MDGVRTHAAIDHRLCGRPTELEEGFARVSLETLPEMAADREGLVHGGFLFGLADHAAMLAVNDPNVVLVGAEVQFLQPVRVGDHLTAEGVVEHTAESKSRVSATVRRGTEEVFKGTFSCYTPSSHVLGPR